MTNIVPSKTFDDVPLIEEGELVKGGEGGPANKQAVALANRTQFLKQELDKTTQSLENLSPSDINAEDRGTASNLVGAHEAAADPHAQYLKQTDAAKKYVPVSGANVPGGFAQLDAGGKIPASLLDMVQSSYVAVADQAARLALPKTDNLTIAAQVDIDTLFYLNGGLDPSVSANWVKGQSATVSGVSRVFGRTGDIVAQAGDYTADQITETTGKQFVAASDKQSWNQKQEKLINGNNIRSFMGQSLLGSGDFSPTPAQLGCAAATHTHQSKDVVDLDSNVKTLIGGNVIPGTGITVGFDPSTGKTTIATNLNRDGSASFVSAVRKGSIAGQLHSFSFTPIAEYIYDAFALISEAGATNQTYVLETFDPANIANYNVSRDMLFTGQLEVYRGEQLPLSLDGTLYKSLFRTGVASFDLSVKAESIVPALSSNTGSTYKASASTEYSSNYMAYKAFDRLNAGGISDGWATGSGVLPTDANPQWLRIDLPAAVKLTGYGLQNRLAGELALVTKWKLQGSNDNGTTWEDIGGVITDTDTTYGKTRNFPVTTSKAYKSYRLFITACDGKYSFAFIQEWLLYAAPPMMFLDDDGTTGYGVSNGALETYPNVTADQINTNGFTVLSGVTPALLSGKNIKTLAAASALTAVVDAYPEPQIALSKKLTTANIWANINSARAVFTETGSGAKLYFAVTRDGTNYYSFANGAWVNIGTLTPDAAGASKLLSQGMKRVDFGNITAAQWKLFWPEGKPDFIAVAYGIEVADASSVAKIDAFTFIVDNASSWRKATPAEVEIRWRSDNVSFKTVNAGDYILSYMIP
jgi:F5/8 type C domain.